MSEIVDLDVLVPPKTVIKIADKEIQIAPPKLVDVVKLEYLVEHLEGDLSEAEIEKNEQEIRDRIVKCIPDLAGIELAIPQIMKLVNILSKMSVPPDVKELEKRGIKVGESDPKDQ